MASEAVRPEHGSAVEFDGGTEAGRTALVPLLGRRTPARVVELAVDLVDAADGTIVVELPASKPRQTPFEVYGSSVEQDHRLASQVRRAKRYADGAASVRGVHRVGADQATVVLGSVDRYGVDTLVVGTGDDWAGPRRGSPAGTIVERADCDVVLGARLGHLGSVTSVLVAVAGGPHSGLACSTARRLAEARGAEVDLFHVTPPSGTGTDAVRAEDVVDAAVDQLGDFRDYDTWVYEAEDAAAAILEQAPHYSLVVLGWPQKGRLERFVFGSTTDSVASNSGTPVLTVRSGDARPTWFERWLARGT